MYVARSRSPTRSSLGVKVSSVTELVYHRGMEQGRDMRAALQRAKEEAYRIPEDRKKQHNQRFDAAQRAAHVQATFRR